MEGKRDRDFRRFFADTGLPLFLISAVLLYEAFLLAIVFAPAEATALWGGFAEEFKRWCFSYDPRTGGMEYASVVVMLIEPLFIGVIAGYLWRKRLLALFRDGFSKRDRRAVFTGLAAGVLVIGGLFLVGRPAPEDGVVLPFPGKRIRVSLEPPPFRLTDQKGVEFGLEDVRGKMVLVTGIYAQCSDTCPDILIQTKDLIDGLPSEVKDRVSIVALSLNPEYDTRDLMSRVAEGYGFEYPQFRYLNGTPDVMNPILKRFGFSKAVDPQTGVVNHASLFLFLDQNGKIAYRLALDGKRAVWLREAVLDLVSEI